MSATVLTPHSFSSEPKAPERVGSSLFFRRSFLSAFIACLGLVLFASIAHAASSEWVYFGTDGKLVYKTTPRGDRIMDFSWAGYMGGGVALPNVPVRGTTLSPLGGTSDDTAAIQARIDSVAAMTPDANGIRGAVLLSSGTFRVNGVINIKSGVVLRGSGSSGASATKLLNVNNRGHIVEMTGTNNGYIKTNKVNVTGSYIPSGSRTLTVSSTAGYSVGDGIIITRFATDAWIAYVGMDNIVDPDDGPETWMSQGDKFYTDRNIVAINGNTITIDAPLTDSFDMALLAAVPPTVEKYTFPGRVSQAGLEKIFIECNGQGGGAFYANDNIDCWVADVFCHDGMNTFEFDRRSRRCTIDNVIIDRANTTTASPPNDFSGTGTQLLFNKCQALRSTTADKTFWTFSSGSNGTGPIAILNLYSTEESGISPHQRWYTGILADNCKLPNAPADTHGIAYKNRTHLGTGHGWTTAWSVAWNVETPYFLVQQAAGSLNWSVGGVGAIDASKPDHGTYDSHGTPVSPSSLYLAQLEERLGYQALVNIGYGTALPAAAAPTFSPAAGNYTSALSVTISSVTSGAAIRYTLDGSNPSPTTGTVYTGPVSLSSSATIKAVAYSATHSASVIVTSQYTITSGGTTAPSPASSGGGGGGGAPTLSYFVALAATVTLRGVLRSRRRK
jgi:hypothetical protein